jgi:hypothetical protein
MLYTYASPAATESLPASATIGVSPRGSRCGRPAAPAGLAMIKHRLNQAMIARLAVTFDRWQTYRR